MSDSLNLVIQCLEPDRIYELVLGLSQDLQKPENLSVLSDLIDKITLSDEILDNIKRYAINVFNSDQDYCGVLKLTQKIPLLYDYMINYIVILIKNYLVKPDIGLIISNEELAIDDSVLFVEEFESSQLGNDLVFTRLLSFLSDLCKSKCLPNDSLDTVLLKCYYINDDRILQLISQIFRWRIKFITNHQFLWQTVYKLQNSTKSHKSYSFILWLRYLSNEPDYQILQTQLQADRYWKFIQLGLISNSHEHRKYCLSILQLSVKLITHDINNKFITWKIGQSTNYLREWSRYVTLFEILGIDTSLHQAEAGMNDILSLISPHSLIESSWGFCLLATGFKATMDSVRKFALKLFLSIDPNYLYKLKDCLVFLEDIYLPNIMIAGNFQIRLVDGKQTCPFGNQIIDFVNNMIQNLNDEDSGLVVESILKVLARHNDCFDPMKIYIGIGLLKGLKTRKVLQFDVHGKYLIKLFESNSEGELFETFCQTIYLRLLLNFKYDQVQFFDALDQFVKVRGSTLIEKNVSLIRDYFASQEIIDDHKNVLLAAITGKYEIFTDLFASKLLQTNLITKLDNSSKQFCFYLLSNVVSGKVNDPEIIEALAMVDFAKYPEIIPDDLSALWKIICTEMDCKDVHRLSLLARKFKLFNKLYENSKFTFDDIETLLNTKVLIHADELSRTIKKFYKISDEIYGEYYSLLNIATKSIKLDSQRIVNLLNCSTDHLQSNLSMIHLVHSMVLNGSDLIPLITFTLELWENLVESRLQLNHKTLQIAIIKTMLDKKVMKESHIETMGNILHSFCLSVIRNSAGRRSLLPALSSMLSEFQVEFPELFETFNWLPEVLVELYLVFQIRTNGFKLEAVLGDYYDKQVLGSGNLYYEIYGPEEVCSKVKVTAILNSLKSKTFANAILNFILDNSTKFNFLIVKRQTDGLEEWTRIQLISIIVSIMDTADIPLNIFERLLETDPSPLVRSYIEWIIAYQLKDNEVASTQVLENFVSSAPSLKMTTLIAYERLLFLMVRQLLEDVEIKLLERLLTVITVNATTNKAITRHFSVSLIVAIRNEIKKKNLDIDKNLISLVDSIYETAINAESFSEFRSGDALLWDIVDDFNLVTIAGGLLLRLSDRDDFDYITYESFKKYLTKDQIQLLNHPVGNDSQELWVKEIKKVSKPKAKGNEQSPLQTKSGAWTSIMDVDEDSRGVEVVRSDLIVVSSLVDKPPNLGGICRLCDVLGAGLLTLDDISVKNNREFKNVAVTADRWMPMIEVKAENIKDYLLEKKKEGYTLIGLEQTDKSVELNYEVKFPKKSLILLGKEKEGVPGDLLAELDFCVEIKQVGVIRSMNIQTATAVLVHAYSVQHC